MLTSYVGLGAGKAYVLPLEQPLTAGMDIGVGGSMPTGKTLYINQPFMLMLRHYTRWDSIPRERAQDAALSAHRLVCFVCCAGSRRRPMKRAERLNAQLLGWSGRGVCLRLDHSS